MKKLVLFMIVLTVALSQIAYSQIDIKKVTDKVPKKDKKDKTEQKDETKTDDKKSDDKDQKKDAVLELGGYFYTAFKSVDYKKSINIGEELFVRMNLGKTMIEYATDLGLSASHSAFGFIVISINGEKVETIGPYSFASNQSKVWKHFDIPLAVDKDSVQKISADQSQLETSQDIWAFQQLFQEAGITVKYPEAAISKMKNDKNTLKIEFGIGESDDKEPKGIICSGEVEIVSDEAGRKELYKKGPKHLVPLEDNEIGEFKFSSNSFALGSGTLTATLDVPFAPKYYNMRWCKANTCDYDHGDLIFVAFLNDEYLISWVNEFEGNDYSENKSFSMTLFPQTDNGINDRLSNFNTSKLFNDHNPVIFTLLDRVYSGRLKNGTHSLRLKVYSAECVPYSASFENTAEYHNTWNSIAETSLQISINGDNRNKIVNSSSAKKLTHAGGEWAAVDAHLKSSITAAMPDIEIVDIATTTHWKVTTNYAGMPLYRDCKADLIYKHSEYGTRRLNSVSIRADYEGGSYGKPYANEVLNTYFYDEIGATFDAVHYPVPLSKVK